MAAHRHWRLYVEDNDGGASIVVAELEMYESPLGENVCTGGTASASSAVGSGLASEAFNQSMDLSISDNVGWKVSSATDEWLAYDFGAGNEKDIVAIGIWSRGTGTPPKDFRLEYSDNGSDWTVLFSVAGSSGWGSKEFRRFVHPDNEPSYASYPHGSHDDWRLFGFPENDDSVAAAEIQMRASVGGADQCTGGTATASSEFSGSFGASKAFDDNPSSLWSTGTDRVAAWIRYQFVAAVDVVEVLIRARSSLPGQTYEGFGLQWKDGAGAWTTAWYVDGEIGWTDGEERTFTDPEVYTVGIAGAGPITPAPAAAGADTFFFTGVTIAPSPADSGAEAGGPQVGPVTPSVTTVSGDPAALTIESSTYLSPQGTAQKFARWQIVVDGGDPDTPADVLYDSFYSDTDFESHGPVDTGIGFGVDVDIYVTHVNENDFESRSAAFDHTTSVPGKQGGLLIEFLESDGSTVVESHTVTTDSESYEEIKKESLERPASSKYVRVTPYKIGSEAKAGSVQFVTVDRGDLAIGYHARPDMPDLDDFHDHGSVSTSSTIDWARGRFQTIDMDANLTATHTNARVGQVIDLLLTQDGAGNRTIDLGASNEPTYSTDANAQDYVRLVKTGASTYLVLDSSIPAGGGSSGGGGGTGATDYVQLEP